jgi:hypothetical protein
MKKSMFFMALVAISMFLTSCTQRTVTVPATTQTKEVEVNVLYEPGDQFTPEHHSKNQVTGKNCAGKTITYNRYEDNGAVCPKTEIGKAHYFTKTPVVENQTQQVVVTDYWSGFGDNSALLLIALIGLALFAAWLFNNWKKNPVNITNTVNSSPQARADYNARPQVSDMANAQVWFTQPAPLDFVETTTVESKTTTTTSRKYDRSGNNTGNN